MKYNPRMFPVLSPLVAPFWADADTTQNGTVWYGERSQDIHDLDCARQNVRKYFCQEDFEPIFVFVATWDKVPHYRRGSKVLKKLYIYIYIMNTFILGYKYSKFKRYTVKRLC